MASKRFFTALHAPGYRWLLSANFAMSAAWTADSLGTGWLVLQLTDSPFWVGFSVGIHGVFQFLLSAWGGAVADRMDRRRVLFVNSLMSAAMTLALALLVLTGSTRLWHIFIYMAASGVLSAINGPTYNALAYDIVGPHRLLNAVAFRFMASGAIRIAAALTGGVLIAKFGTGPNYLFVSSAFLLAGLALLPIKSAACRVIKATEPPLGALWTGLRYSMHTRPVRELLLLSLITEAFGFSYMYMMPVMARDVLHIGAVGLGYLNAAGAAGQLLGAIILVSLGDFRAKGWLLLGATFFFGLSITLFAFSPWFLVSLAIMTVVGGTAGIYDSTMSTTLQMSTSSEMRGRVLGLYTSTWGSNQVGGFGLGALGTLLTMPLALALTGGAVAAYALRLVPIVRLFNASTAETTPEAPETAPPQPDMAQT